MVLSTKWKYVCVCALCVCACDRPARKAPAGGREQSPELGDPEEVWVTEHLGDTVHL